MLSEEDFDLFRQFRCRAMGETLRTIVNDEAYDKFTFEEKVKLMLDAEAQARRDRKVAKIVREANFKNPKACIEDIIYLPHRSLVRDRMARYAECGWVERCEVMVVISKTGGGKSYLCQALGNAACRKLHKVHYIRLADLFDELNRARAKGNGSYFETVDLYKSVELLILDDFMTTPIDTQSAVDLFEIIEAREGRTSTLIASQLEPNEWYLRIQGELMADSILNRLATGAHYIDLEGPNMREYFAEMRKTEEATI